MQELVPSDLPLTILAEKVHALTGSLTGSLYTRGPLTTLCVGL